jgi:P4 family phage/plasmid primase-like protien
MIPINFDAIPQYMREQPRWTVWFIPDWLQGAEKPKKVIRLPTGQSCPEGYAITKNTGEFSVVRQACENNPKFYPAFWIEEKDGLIFLDYDGTSNNIPPIPQMPSYCERSVYGFGYHIIGWYKGTKPSLPTTDEVYLGGRWIVMTGCVVDNRSSVNDLSDYLKKFIIPEQDGIKIIDKFTVPVTAASRHPVLKKMVASMVARGYSFTAILAACQAENIVTFKPPKTAAEIDKEVTNLYDWVIKKQTIKALARENEKKDVEEQKIETLPKDDGIRATANWLSGKYLTQYPLVKFNVHDGCWYFYNGKVWEKDERFHIYRGIMEWSQEQYQLAANGDSKEAHLTVDLLRRIHTKPDTLDPVMKVRCAVLSSDFDKDNHIINCQNGTLDTRTWKLSPHHQDDLCRSIVNANYDEKATCPKWEAHVSFMFNSNPALMAWFQCLCGYTLRLGNPAQQFNIWYGLGNNGKTVANLTLHFTMGSYAHTTSPQTFHSKRYDDATTANPSLCDCSGKRFISCSESKEGAVLDAGIVKQTTGGDEVEGRYLHQNTFRFFIHGTPMYLSNHAPRVRDMTPGMWRRLKMVPFTNTVPADKRVLEYEKQLMPESDGIFLWMVKGLKKFDELNGFPECKEIDNATAQYRTDNDVVGQYIAEHCLCMPNVNCRLEDITKDCLAFCQDMGIQKISKKSIRSQIQEHGFSKIEPVTDHGWYIRGIRVSNPFIKNLSSVKQVQIATEVSEGGMK